MSKKKYLVFDVETSGFQPPAARVAELAFQLIDEDGVVLTSYSNLVRPNGWTIPKSKFFIDNGMSTERNLKLGVDIRLVLGAFSDALNQADFVVAHNFTFDRKFMSHEFTAAGLKDDAVLLNTRPAKCTMLGSEDYCALPGRYPGKYKWPKLEELHQKLFGCKFDGAHEALSDVKATSKCLTELIRLKIM